MERKETSVRRKFTPIKIIVPIRAEMMIGLRPKLSERVPISGTEIRAGTAPAMLLYADHVEDFEEISEIMLVGMLEIP